MQTKYPKNLLPLAAVSFSNNRPEFGLLSQRLQALICHSSSHPAPDSQAERGDSSPSKEFALDPDLAPTEVREPHMCAILQLIY